MDKAGDTVDYLLPDVQDIGDGLGIEDPDLQGFGDQFADGRELDTNRGGVKLGSGVRI